MQRVDGHVAGYREEPGRHGASTSRPQWWQVTQEALAGAAGMDRAFLDTIHRIADALGVHVTDLFTR